MRIEETITNSVEDYRESQSISFLGGLTCWIVGCIFLFFSIGDLSILPVGMLLLTGAILFRTFELEAKLKYFLLAQFGKESWKHTIIKNK